jgi:hypothetical protein
VLLILTPWTSFWDRNRFAEWLPALAAAMSSEYVRGAVSGVGVVTTLAGLRDLIAVLFARSSRAAAAPPAPPTP